MSLDLTRLENARERGGKTTARCPACAEAGNDTKGEHLVIMPDGRFGCVAHPGAAGKVHRQRIFALAGVRSSRGCMAGAIRVRRPPEAGSAQGGMVLAGMGRFERVSAAYAEWREGDSGAAEDHDKHADGTGGNPSQPSHAAPAGRLGRVFPTLTRTRGEKSKGEEVGKEVHRGRVRQNPSQASRASHDDPQPTRPPAPAPHRDDPEAHALDPLIKRASDTFGKTGHGGEAVQEIDPETGYPIIDGAICPF